MRAIASTSFDRSAGFTLVELAVAVFIIALLLGSILVPLQSQVESRKYDETQRILDQAREALLGYAAANGFFPCPADYAGGSAGQEATGTNHGSGGSCPASVTGGGATGVYVGFLPATTLGFTPADAQGYAIDAWGLVQNRIRYAVSAQNVNSANNCTTNSVTRPLISANGMRNATMQCVMNSTLLSVCNTATGATTTACANAASTLVSNAIVVVWSLGPNAATGGGTSAQELKNAQALASADRVFVMRTKSNVGGSEFDDVVTWIAPPTVFNRLIAAGQLP
jgi:prepilin-type N-terminal cleavage/methylation domain-containing protein